MVRLPRIPPKLTPKVTPLRSARRRDSWTPLETKVREFLNKMNHWTPSDAGGSAGTDLQQSAASQEPGSLHSGDGRERPRPRAHARHPRWTLSSASRRSDGEADVDYRAFVDGELRCPPEDVGGVPGLMQFLEAALEPLHEEHRDESVVGLRIKVIDDQDMRCRFLTCMAVKGWP